MTIQPSPLKLCAACGEPKAVEFFHRQPTGKMGRHSWCKACFNKKAKASCQKTSTPEQKRRWNLASRYGITSEIVAEMKERQGNLCAICTGPLDRMHIDHCHKTGKVRGLLCHGCNIKLPAVEDREFLKAALAYLKQS